MKKIMIAVAIGSLVVLSGCLKTEDMPEANSAWNVIDHSSAWGSTGYKVVEIEAHRYIVVRSTRGVAVVHAESCPCKAK